MEIFIIIIICCLIFILTKGNYLFLLLLMICLMIYVLRNPTVALIPYNFMIEQTSDKKVFYSDSEKKEIFPTSEILERNWETIKKEFLLLSRNNKEQKNIGERFIQQDADFWKGWTTFELRSFDKDNKENMKYCPTLSEILRKDPNISTAFFSVVEPGKTISSHYGPFKGILRYHLGLIIPPKESGYCFISVDNQLYDWKNGEGVLFDESHKHFVKNETKYHRVILFIDVRRPVWCSSLNNFILYLMSISPYNF